jgi:hypothetical protein
MKHPHYDLIVWALADVKNNKVQMECVDGPGGWADQDVSYAVVFTDKVFRRKPAPPKRITINGVEINAPLSEAPEYMARVFAFDILDGVFELCWVGSVSQKLALSKGGICATEQDAQAAYDAITLALTGGNQ